MGKLAFLLLFTFAFPVQVTAQWLDFPTGLGKKPKTKLKGAVHTVLTIEQREENVFSTVVEVYDLKGRLIETTSSNAGIEIHSRTMVRLGGKSVYVYDTSGKLAKERNFTPEGEYIGHETYIYDAKNRLVETNMYDRNGQETGKSTYTYFPEKREVIATWNFHYGNTRDLAPMKNVLSYNEKGQWIKRTEFGRKETPGDSITFEYDQEGNFIKETTCGEYNYGHRYTYKFDKQGNWIERENTGFQFDKSGKEELRPGWMNEYRVITYYSDHDSKR